MERRIEEDLFQPGSSEDSIFEDYSLPYHWDKECHLILNENFYLGSLSFEPELFEPPPTFELPLEIPSQPIREQPITKDIICSESSGSTVDKVEVPEPLPKRTKTLDAQLDFIMTTCQKHQPSQEKTNRRNRKSPEQLMILIEELGEVPRKISRKEIKAAALKAGLTELQVYKWHYDRKCRLA